MAHRVPGCVQAFEIDGHAHLDDVTGADTAVHIGYAPAGVPVRDNLRARGCNHGLVAADVVAMLVRIDDLGNAPSPVLRYSEALAEIERIDSKSVAGLGAGNDVVEIPVCISCPDLFYDHLLLLVCRLVHELTADPGLQYADIVDLARWYFEIIAIDNDEVSPLAPLETAEAVFLVRGISRCKRK
jgi:hypothetical protein